MSRIINKTGLNKDLRLFNSMRNSYWNFIGQILLIFSGLFLRRQLLLTLGLQKIGLNYLFNDIVALISIAELGITGIIAFHLYKPLSLGEVNKVKQLMDLFKKVYIILGFSVLIIGCCIIPFLPSLVGETKLSSGYIAIVFLMFLLRSVEGYFLSYKQLLLHADQKSYIIFIVDIITTLIYTVIALFVLWLTKSFVLVISLEILKKAINDIIIMKIVNKRYSFMARKDVPNLEIKEIKKILANVKDTFVSNISKSVINATDNIIISIFLGIKITGYYAGYAMILKTIEKVIKELLESVQGSIGNLLVEEKGELIYSVLKKMTFISFFLVSISGCCLILLTTPFISMWFGKEYIMAEMVVWVCVVNIFLYILQLGVIQYANAGGLFKDSKVIDIIGAALNVVLSIIGVKLFGIVGVFVATFISRGIEFILRINLVFSKILEISQNRYLLEIFGYFIVFLAESIVLLYLSSYMNIQNLLLSFFAFGLLAVFVPLSINILIYFRTENYKYMMHIIKSFIFRR